VAAEKMVERLYNVIQWARNNIMGDGEKKIRVIYLWQL
jgi:hypothetical protein